MLHADWQFNSISTQFSILRTIYQVKTKKKNKENLNKHADNLKRLYMWHFLDLHDIKIFVMNRNSPSLMKGLRA